MMHHASLASVVVGLVVYMLEGTLCAASRSVSCLCRKSACWRG